MDLIIWAAEKKNIKNGIPFSFRLRDKNGLELGNVSSGLSLEEKRALLDYIKEDANLVWITPTLVEVEYQEIIRTNGDIRLRSPRMIRTRKDKNMNEATVIRVCTSSKTTKTTTFQKMSE